MKKIDCGIWLVVTILSFLFLYPQKALALTEETSYIDINDIQNFQVGSLNIINLTFKDNSLTSTLSFGLTGSITNNSNKAINCTSKVYYYDSNYNLIAQSQNISKTSEFNQMSSIFDVRLTRFRINYCFLFVV